MRTVMLACSFLSLAAPAFAGKVWVVGPGAGQLHDLQDTIIQAQPGDVVLVKSGTYESIRTVGRSLTVVADVGANVQLQGAIRVIDLPPGSTATFSGLKAFAVANAGVPEMNAGLWAKGSGGRIVVQDCTLANPATTQALAAANLEECGSVSIVRSNIWGFTGTPSYCPPLNGTLGLRVGPGALVDVQQSNVRAGPGRSFACQTAIHGVGDAPLAPSGLNFTAPTPGKSSFVFASACQFTGGRGGDGDFQSWLQPLCGTPGRGGDGIFGWIPNGQLVLLGVTALGGAGGIWNPMCGVGPAPTGDPIYAGPWWYWYTGVNYPATPFTALPGAPRSLSGSTVVRDTMPVSLDCAGTSGERVDIAVSRTGLGFKYQAMNSGVLHIPNPIWRRIGAVPTSGVLHATLPLPDLPLSDPGATFFVQARFVDPSSGQMRLSNLHTFIEVDASY